MTLIACTINYKVPFVTADILMSSHRGKDNVILPTNNFDVNPYIPADAHYRPDSLAQKLYIFGNNVCIAVAGAEVELTPFLMELQIRCRLFENINELQLKCFLNDYDLSRQLPNSAFILLSVEHRQPDSLYVGMFNFPQRIDSPDTSSKGGWKSMENEIFEEVLACGSGAESYLNIVSQTGVFETRHTKGDIWYAMQSNVALIAKILAIERITLHNLKTNWGGGFETAFYNGRKFEKVSDMVYVVCNGQFDEHGDIGLPFPGLFLYYTYSGTTLNIMKVEVKSFLRKEDGDKIILTAFSENFNAHCFEAEQLGSPQENKRALDGISFKTHTVAIGYGIITPDQGVFNPTSYNMHGALTVTYDHNNKIEMILSRAICEDIRVASKKVYDINWSK